jgi:lipopolysaccharide export system protein LptC
MHGGPASEPAARSRAFNKARRHSRWVRFAKVAIPLGAVAAMVLIGLFAYLNPFRKIEGLSVGSVGVNGTNVTMESPKLTGFKNDNRPYEVTASAATQDVGVLDTQKEQMNLRQDVRVRTDSGQEAQLRSAFVDFKAGTVVSDEPVTVNLGNGVINAAGLKVTDNGKVFQFKGRVSSTFAPSGGNSPAPVPAGTGPAAPAAQPTSVRP